MPLNNQFLVQYGAGLVGYPLYVWGGNYYGRLALGDTVSRSVPIRLGSDDDWSSIILCQSSIYSLKTDGTLWCWGLNNCGQLGLGDAINRSSPVQIGSDSDWSSFGVYDRDAQDQGFIVALKTNGTLWSWGRNNYGQLGLGDVISRSSPVQIGTDTDWASIKVDQGPSVFALKSDGTLWGWGLNTDAQLGIGNILNRSSPTQVGTDTDWEYIATDYDFTTAIKSNGTLWVWGYGAGGGLGLGDTVSRSSPVQLGSDNDWSYISVSGGTAAAVKTNGTLWGWGMNWYGELGNGSVEIHSSSPVQLGSDTDWGNKVIRFDTLTMAIKENGTLWGWGRGAGGVLGLGDTEDRSIPTQVGLENNWDNIAIKSRGHMLLIKTDGTLWSWGYNTDGQLGLGDTINRSSPVQVGSDDGWNNIYSANYSAFGLKN